MTPADFRKLYFNSQPHEEADDVGLLIPMLEFPFQLAASRGG